MSQKKQRPFRLATTSFIYPDYILPNVLKLGAFFDEIELLVFESREDALPTTREIKALEKEKNQQNLTYNIHLPTDISLTHEDRDMRKKAARQYAQIMDLLAVLEPSTHTLHLEMPEALKGQLAALGQSKTTKKQRAKWLKEAEAGLETLFDQGIQPADICIETLDYDIDTIGHLIQAMGLDVCLDMGHVIKYGYDLQSVISQHKDHLPLIHLHGVQFQNDLPKKDHTSLDQMPQPYLKQIIAILASFTGTVSIEVFNRNNLNASLKVLSQYFEGIPESV